jgi:hypothetical protein
MQFGGSSLAGMGHDSSPALLLGTATKIASPCTVNHIKARLRIASSTPDLSVASRCKGDYGDGIL